MRRGWIALLLVLVFGLTAQGLAAEKPLKGALVLFGKIDDASWNAAIYQAARRVEKEVQISWDYTESVKPADAERVIRDYASRGYDLIIGHAFAYSKPTLKVAQDFPKVHFAHGLDADKIAANVTGYRVLFHEGGYLAGMLAGMMTKTNKIGAVNTVSIPPQIILGEAFKEGVKVVNPQARVFMTYTGSFEDPVKGREAGTAMVDQGADFIFAMGDGTGLGPIAVAREKAIPTIGVYGDQSPLSPLTMVTSVVLTWDNLVRTLVKDLRGGTFGNKKYELTMKDGIIDLAPYNRFDQILTTEQKAAILRAKADILTGKLQIPIITQIRQ